MAKLICYKVPHCFISILPPFLKSWNHHELTHFHPQKPSWRGYEDVTWKQPCGCIKYCEKWVHLPFITRRTLKTINCATVGYMTVSWCSLVWYCIFWRGWCREDHLFFLSSLWKRMTLAIIYLDDTFNLFKSSYIMPSLFNQAHLFAPTEQSDEWGEWENALSPLFLLRLWLSFSPLPFTLLWFWKGGRLPRSLIIM